VSNLYDRTASDDAEAHRGLKAFLFDYATTRHGPDVRA